MKNDDPLPDPGELLDGDLCLVLVEKRPPDPEKGFVAVYNWDIRRIGDDVKMGEFGLKIGDLPPHVGHVRYRVFPDFRGHHYAARACRLVLPLARRHGMEWLRITCREDNIASRRTAEHAGATLVGMIEMPVGYRDWIGPVRTKCDYRLSTSEDLNSNRIEHDR